MWSTTKQENEMKACLFSLYTILRHPQGKEKEIEKKGNVKQMRFISICYFNKVTLEGSPTNFEHGI